MVLGKLLVPGRPTNLDHSRARAYCTCSRCGWGMFGHFFSCLSFISSPSLWETARYRLKYCLKGPLSPKQPTNQRYNEKPTRNNEKPTRNNEKQTCYNEKPNRYNEKPTRNYEKPTRINEQPTRYNEKPVRNKEKLPCNSKGQNSSILLKFKSVSVWL